MSEIRKKTVLVTGGARRIGRAVCLELMQAGWAVCVHYNDSRDEAEHLVRELKRQGGHAAALQADLENESEVAELVPRAQEEFGILTGLVNNASIFEKDEFDTVTRKSWDRHIAINLRAPFVLSQHLARQLEGNREGAICNLLDQRVLNLAPGFMSYTMTKSALWALTRTMALALAPRIRVNGVGPGPTLRSAGQDEDAFTAHWTHLPLARPVPVEDVAAAVRFLMETPSVTGQMIATDCGEHLGHALPNRGFVPQE